MKKKSLFVLLATLIVSLAYSAKAQSISSANLSLISEVTKSLNSNRNAKPEAVGKSDEAYSILVKTVQQRQIELSTLAKQNPQLALKYVIKKDIRQRQTQKVQTYIEEDLPLSGTIQVVHVDDFKHPEKSYYSYSVLSSNNKVNIYTARDINIRSGSRVQIKGYRLNSNEFLTDGESSSVEILNLPEVGALGKQRTIIFLLNSPSDPAEIMTTKQAEDYVNKGQFQNFIKESSYGQTWFEAKAYGWITVNNPGVSACSFASLRTPEVISYILQNNIDLSNYDRVIFFSPGYGGCSGVGKSDMGSSNYSVSNIGITNYNQSSGWGYQPFSWTNLDYLLSHELGHALGLWHANGMDCGDKAMTGECNHVEYGNNYDAMGAGGAISLQYNGFYKEILGWIKPQNILYISNSGKYTLDLLESTSTTAKKFAEVYSPQLSTKVPSILLELRGATGFDSNISSVSPINKNSGILLSLPVFTFDSVGKYINEMSRLIDTNPTSDDWYGDIHNAGIRPGQIPFVDVSSGITVGPVSSQSKDSTTFDVVVDKPSCVTGNPSFQEYFDNGVNVVAGGMTSIGLQVFNNDSPLCGNSKIEIKYIFPDGWINNNFDENPPAIEPRTIGYRNLNFTVPSGAVIGIQKIKFYALNQNTNLVSKTMVANVNVLPPPTITSVEPKIARPGSHIKITGTGFNEKQPFVYLKNESLGVYESISSVFHSDSVEFDLPKEFCKYSIGNPSCTKVVLSDGIYQIEVTGFGVNVTANIQIGSDDSKDLPSISDVEVKSVIEQEGNYSIAWKAKKVDYVNIDLMDAKGLVVIKPLFSNFKISVGPDGIFGLNSNLIPGISEDVYTIRVSSSIDKKIFARSGKVEIVKKPVEKPNSAEILGTPELKLIYDRSKNESALSASYRIRFTAGKDNLHLYGVFADAERIPQLRNISTTVSINSAIISVSGATKSGDYYILKKDVPATFDIQANFNPKIMFAGKYVSNVEYINVYDPSRGDQYVYFPFTLVPTNAVTIIGETSPYIYNIFFNKKLYPGSQVNLPGVRLDQNKNIINLNNIQVGPIKLSPIPTPTPTPDINTSPTNGSLMFNIPENITPGYYGLQVTNDQGKSNIIGIVILPNPQSVQSAIKMDTKPAPVPTPSAQAIPVPTISISPALPSPINTTQPMITTSPGPSITPSPSPTVTTSPSSSVSPSPTASSQASSPGYTSNIFDAISKFVLSIF